MAVMEGPLSKWTNVMKGWQYRWFVLDSSSGILSYFTVSSIHVTYHLHNSTAETTVNEVFENV